MERRCLFLHPKDDDFEDPDFVQHILKGDGKQALHTKFGRSIYDSIQVLNALFALRLLSQCWP